MQLYLTMPKPGETIREGSIIQWFKKIGDSVEERESLVELETEKAVFTYESPFRGTLKEILVSENENVNVGAPLALFEVSEEDGAKYTMLGVGLPVGEKREELGVRSEEKKAQPLYPSPLTPHPSPVSYSPLIRNLAKEHGLTQEELDQIPRTGPGGRLTKEDLLGYVKKRGTTPLTPALSPKGEGEKMEFEKISLSPIRLRIAKHMKKSHAEIPQAASSVDVDVTEIQNFIQSHQEFTPFFFFVYAVKEVLKKFPLFNASFIEEGEKSYIHQHKNLHLGFAVATSQGLLNPVIHHAQNLNFKELAIQIAQLGKKAREGKLSVEELTGATFAVNNPGAMGGARCYQIIPSPLVAIVGLNRVQTRPWVAEGKIVPREVVVVDLSFDHRVLDGADAIRFLEEVKKILEKFPFEVVKK
jgi:pyruvate/2-oxoglutarate dehydrogenase complex dihydrolipoamide acyltransferase (E2) component